MKSEIKAMLALFVIKLSWKETLISYKHLTVPSYVAYIFLIDISYP